MSTMIIPAARNTTGLRQGSREEKGERRRGERAEVFSSLLP
jgi:hypothetical protein